MPAGTGDLLMQRIELLAEISESPDGLTRRFATPEHKLANATVAGWMQQCGMQTREDNIGNIIGRYEGASPNAPAIMIGSHLDTVVMAGKYDGMLGVLSGISCVEYLHANDRRLPFAVEVIGFADEEGVRYQSTYLGSKALTGELAVQELQRTDADGITMSEALQAFGKNPDKLDSAQRSAEEIRAYLELHIEQGPVLEHENLPVGVVTGIAGATRLMIEMHGVAGHAGTVPMSMRQDALAASAEAIIGIENLCSANAALVGTVGQIRCEPGATNVIPGFAAFTIDVRSANNRQREQAVDSITKLITESAAKRRVECVIEILHNESSVDCAPQVVAALGKAIESMGSRSVQLASGAGHDAAAMASLTQVGMLFVRCEGGISHNPAESVTVDDAAAGAEALLRAVLEISKAE